MAASIKLRFLITYSSADLRVVRGGGGGWCGRGAGGGVGGGGGGGGYDHPVS